MLSLLVVVALCMPSQDPSGADARVTPPEQDASAPVISDEEAQPTQGRIILSALAAMGTTAAIAAPALVLAVPVGLGLGAIAGYVAAEKSLMGGLALLALNPVLMTMILAAPLLAAPWVGWAVMRWMTDKRAGPFTTALPATVVTLVGAVTGLLVQEGGVVVGLAATVVLFVVVVAVQVMAVAFCSQACGSPVEYQEPRMVDLKLGADARSRAMVLFSLWTLSCVAPTALGTAVGLVAGPALGGVVTTRRMAEERAALAVPLEGEDAPAPPNGARD